MSEIITIFLKINQKVWLFTPTRMKGKKIRNVRINGGDPAINRNPIRSISTQHKSQYLKVFILKKLEFVRKVIRH